MHGGSSFLGGKQKNLIVYNNNNIWVHCVEFECRERGARALEERLASERLGSGGSTKESGGRDAAEEV